MHTSSIPARLRLNGMRRRLARHAAVFTAGALLAAGSLAFAAPAQASPVSVQHGGMTFTADDTSGPEGGATVTAYTGPGAEVIVPSEITIGARVYPVTAIGEQAFWSKNLTSVTLPTGLVSIGDLAFPGNNLTEIVIPNSVTTIGKSAFSANKLTSVTLSSNLREIDDTAFSHNLIAHIDFPALLTRIGEQAFSENRLTSVELPNSLITLDKLAFEINNVTSVSLGNSLEFIGMGAFSWNAVTSVVIPASVRTIDGFVFGKNSELFRTPQDLTHIHPDSIRAVDSTLRSVTFLGAAPTTVTGTHDTENDPPRINGHFESWGSFGTGHALMVNYPVAFETGDESTGFATGAWQGYASQAFATVSFDLNGHGDAIAEQAVTVGTATAKPTAPAAAGYTFTGWYTDKAATKQFGFSSTITADTVLYAGWKAADPTAPADTATVSFNLNGHGAAIAEQTVVIGAAATKPAAPLAAGYTFTGWYSDKAATKHFDFSSTITADTVLYAGWSRNATTLPTPGTSTPTPAPTSVPSTPTADAALASTGSSDPSGVVTIALALLLLGAGLMAVRRRRRV